jgi:sugar (pentulose or hexulose) kinase
VTSTSDQKHDDVIVVTEDHVAPPGEAGTGAEPGTGGEAGTGGETGSDPWPEIQARFVDDPRSAVEQAAEVTTAALAALTAAGRSREQSLRGSWQADDTGTEELRTSLRDYRELAQRLSGLAGQL